MYNLRESISVVNMNWHILDDQDHSIIIIWPKLRINNIVHHEEKKKVFTISSLKLILIVLGLNFLIDQGHSLNKGSLLLRSLL